MSVTLTFGSSAGTDGSIEGDCFCFYERLEGASAKMKRLTCAILTSLLLCAPANAGTVLFDFDNATPHSSVNNAALTVDGLTASFKDTGQGFSFQTLGPDTIFISPAGFSGVCIFPNSINASDLVVSFTQQLTGFSILYATEEYGTDMSGLMKVSAYENGTLVGSSTAQADGGTWPSATLSFNSPEPFNSVVVHWVSHPPSDADWGPIFMADNMTVTTAASTVIPEPSTQVMSSILFGMIGVAWSYKKLKQTALAA